MIFFQQTEGHMAAAQRKPAITAETAEPGRKQRTDPQRLKAFAQRLNVMLGELGLPERGRAKVIKDRVGVSGTTAANWLRGESYPSFEELGRMGRLGVDPIGLFSDADERAPTGANATRAGAHDVEAPCATHGIGPAATATMSTPCACHSSRRRTVK
jgi:transcriptional regulator with XRE-family HTH domain